MFIFNCDSYGNTWDCIIWQFTIIKFRLIEAVRNQHVFLSLLPRYLVLILSCAWNLLYKFRLNYLYSMQRLSLLVNSPFKFWQIRNVSSVTASITKTHRLLYCRLYPTVVVQPDGSTINIRYHEPRQIIRVSVKKNRLWFYNWFIKIVLFCFLVAIWFDYLIRWGAKAATWRQKTTNHSQNRGRFGRLIQCQEIFAIRQEIGYHLE